MKKMIEFFTSLTHDLFSPALCKTDFFIIITLPVPCISGDDTAKMKKTFIHLSGWSVRAPFSSE